MMYLLRGAASVDQKHPTFFWAVAELCSSRNFLGIRMNSACLPYAHFGNDPLLLCMLGTQMTALVFSCLYAAHHSGYNFAS